jgi:hypothetical protein
MSKTNNRFEVLSTEVLNGIAPTHVIRIIKDKVTGVIYK